MHFWYDCPCWVNGVARTRSKITTTGRHLWFCFHFITHHVLVASSRMCQQKNRIGFTGNSGHWINEPTLEIASSLRPTKKWEAFEIGNIVTYWYVFVMSSSCHEMETCVQLFVHHSRVDNLQYYSRVLVHILPHPFSRHIYIYIYNLHTITWEKTIHFESTAQLKVLLLHWHMNERNHDTYYKY